MTPIPTIPDDVLALAQRIAAPFTASPHVVAVALAGSQTTRATDERSDIDRNSPPHATPFHRQW